MKAVIDNRVHLYGDIDEKILSQIKEDLTFANKQYETVMRYSKYRYTSVPPYLFYYSLTKDELTVPVGYNFLKYFDCVEIEDERVCPPAKVVPHFALSLRESQKEAAEEFIKNNANIIPKGSIQMPTGKGKSILGLYLAHYYKTKTLIVVHKDDLVQGWKKDIDLAFDKKVVPGIIKAKSRTIGDFLTIATVQTLNRLSKEELYSLHKEFGLVIQDEQHHCVLGNSLVLTPDGGVVKAENIKEFDKIYGGEVKSPFYRKSEVYRLSSKHGFIEGSPDHLTFCLDKRKYYNSIKKECDFSSVTDFNDFEVKPISEIDSNYVVPILSKVPHLQKNYTSEEEASFAAMIMCDGHLDKGASNRVKVNATKDEKYYEKTFSNYLGVDGYKKNYDCRGNFTLWTTDKSVKSLLKNKWEIPVGKKSHFIRVPDFLYYAPIDTIKKFIETCFSCEGDLSCTNNNWRINFNTCSKEFAQGLSILLKKFGIVSNIRYVDTSSTEELYRVSCGGVMFNLFMDTFNLISRKNTSERNSGNLNKNRFVGDYLLSDVLSVYSLGYEDIVYDFEVPSTHSFVANGVLTHNCPSTSFSIVNGFKCRYRLGLTATPERSDGLAHVMNLYFGDFCYRYKATEEDKDILPVKVKRRKLNLYVNPVCKKIAGNYEVVDFLTPEGTNLKEGEIRISDIPYNLRPRISYQTLDDIVVRGISPAVIQDIVKEYNEGRSCVVFFTQKEHCRLYYDFLKEFIPENHLGLYYGDNSDNDSVLKQAEEIRKFVTLTTYAKATEGTNVKQWEVEFLVSSVNNEKNVEQAVGRIRRTKPGNKISPAIVYDYRTPFVYSMNSHGRTRDKRYSQLGFSDYYTNTPKKNLFNRGYR